MPDGERVISCGSDGTLRTWHIGQQRCESVVRPGANGRGGAGGGPGLFAAVPHPSSGGILTADSGGRVRLTDPTTAASAVVCTTNAPALRLHLAGEGVGSETLWVATTASCLTSYQLPPGMSVTAGEDPTDMRDGGRCRPQPSDEPSRVPPERARAVVTIAGRRAVRHHATLPCRTKVLVEEDTKACALWDVMSATCVQRWEPLDPPEQPQTHEGGAGGPLDAQAAAGSRFEMLLKGYEKTNREQDRVAVPVWFSTSAKSGSLELTVEAPGCFSAEAYCIDLTSLTPPPPPPSDGAGGATAPAVASDPELRVNLGERFLASVFRPWRDAARAARCDAARSGTGPALTAQEKEAEEEEATLPCFSSPNPDCAGVVILVGGVCLVKARLSALPPAPAQLPRWLAEYVTAGRFVPGNLTISFVLRPLPDSSLPAIPAAQARLSAPLALKATRIAAHVQRTLRLRDDVVISLYCGLPGEEEAVPSSMSLQAARHFLWKQGGDLVLCYDYGDART